MEEYIVSARKYRPMTFDSVVGQSALTTTLKNAVKSGKLAHAYLFCGPRGVGKTTCARIFAKAINCEHPKEDGEACNECESCKSFNEQRGALNSTSVIDAIYILCSYTYGPLLGLFAFGLMTHRNVNDRWVPWICIASPLICFAVDTLTMQLTGYKFGYELLMLNGALTFAGLALIRK